MASGALGLKIYLAIVVGIGAFLCLRALLWISRTHRSRSKAVERRRFLGRAIRTESPQENAEEIARERAFESIENKSTVTRRLLLPLIVIATGLLTAIPFVDQMPATVLSVVLAAITVVIGVAARPTVENAIAGLVLSSSRMLSIGDLVKMGEHYGSVEDINTTHTTIKLWDWRRLVLPNSQMLQSSFLNYSLHDRFLWAYAEFTVDYDADLGLVERLAKDVATGSKYFAGHESPRFWVMETRPEYCLCWIAAWANSPSDAWNLTSDIRSGLVSELKQHGIAPHLKLVRALPEELPNELAGASSSSETELAKVAPR